MQDRWRREPRSGKRPWPSQLRFQIAGETVRFLDRLEGMGGYWYLTENHEWVPAAEIERWRERRLSAADRALSEKERRLQLVTKERAARHFKLGSRQAFDKYRSYEEPYPFPAPATHAPLRWRLGELEDWFLDRQAEVREPRRDRWVPLVRHLDGLRRDKRVVTVSFETLAELLPWFPPRKALERDTWWRDYIFKPDTPEGVGWKLDKVNRAEGWIRLRRL
jgi:hypothetical protein